VCSDICRRAQVFQNSRTHLKILKALMVTLNNWRAEGPPLLGAAVQTLVALVNWNRDLCTPGAKINFAGTVVLRFLYDSNRRLTVSMLV
jgi:hypothetical protein